MSYQHIEIYDLSVRVLISHPDEFWSKFSQIFKSKSSDFHTLFQRIPIEYNIKRYTYQRKNSQLLWFISRSRSDYFYQNKLIFMTSTTRWGGSNNYIISFSTLWHILNGPHMVRVLFINIQFWVDLAMPIIL